MDTVIAGAYIGVGGVVIGVLLTLLVGPVAETIRRRRARAMLVHAINAELADVRDRATVTFQYVKLRLGEFRKPDMVWIAERLSISSDKYAQANLANLRALMEHSEETLKAIAEKYKAEANRGASVSFRRLELPFLASQLH